MTLKTTRLLALDQSSKLTGYAIFQNGELDKYDYFGFDGTDVPSRLIKIRDKINQIIEEENITRVAIEEIQLQYNNSNNVVTYKTLAFVMAVILVLCKERKIPCEIIPSVTWKSACGIKGRARAEQKKNAKAFVLEKFGLDLPQDTVDAICLGYSVSKKDKNKIEWG